MQNNRSVSDQSFRNCRNLRYKNNNQKITIVKDFKELKCFI